MKTALPVRVEMTPRRRTKKYPPLSREQQRLVAEHQWIASRLAYGAKCLTGGHTGSLTREDLQSIASFAICVAASRYRPEMGIKFVTYAWSTARGYLRHALRDYSRMVRTPRWVANYRNEVKRLVQEGVAYDDIADTLGTTVDRIHMTVLAEANYHVSYDSRPDDWCSKEFVYEDNESKSSLLSPELVKEMKSLSDSEMSIMVDFVSDKPLTENEREWASDKFHFLSAIAHGMTGDPGDAD